MARDRIDTTFHETFALNLPMLSAVLGVCGEYEGEVAPELLATETTLGPNQVKAMPRYARGSGLLKMGSFDLTDFGRAVLANDPNLMGSETLWLLHYHLCAPYGPGPSFWHHLITSRLRLGESISRAEVAKSIGGYISGTTGKALSARTLESTATAFLGTYSKTDALGRLGIMTVTEESKGLYEVAQPAPPAVWTLGYALAQFWESVSPNASELLLKDLARQDGFAGLFFMGSGMLGALLSELQSSGVVTIKRDAPPFVVTRLWSDPKQMLRSIYA